MNKIETNPNDKRSHGMKNCTFVFLFIIIVCAIYLFNGRHLQANMDERSSIVIALGKYPSLTDSNGAPVSYDEYRKILDLKMYAPGRADFKNVFRSVLHDNSNGIWYYFLLSAYMQVVGMQLLWLRMFSVFLAGFNLYLIYLLAGKFQNRPFFQWTALLLTAVNPLFSQDAILIRSYMLALLGCLLSLFLLEKIILDNKAAGRYFLFYFLGILLAAGSHYFTFSVLAAEFAFIVWCSLRRSRLYPEFLAGWIFLFFCALGWLFLIYPVGLRNLHFLQTSSKTLSVATGYQFTLVNLFIQWFNTAAYSIGFTGQGNRLIGIFVKCLSASMFILAFIKLWKLPRTPQQELLIFLIFFLMIFYSLQSLLTGHLTNFIPHYLFFIIPLFNLCITTALSVMTGKRIGMEQ